MIDTVIFVLIVVALVGVLLSLGFGVFNMGFGQKNEQLDTEPYMWSRISFQTIAVILLGIAAVLQA